MLGDKIVKVLYVVIAIWPILSSIITKKFPTDIIYFLG